MENKNICNYCHNINIRFAEGGHSTLYYCNNIIGKCIRTIPIYRDWKYIKNEIIVSETYR